MSRLFQTIAARKENAVKEAIINTLKENVLDIQYEIKERSDSKTLQLSETSSALCTTVEALFLHGLKDSLLLQTISIIAGSDEATSRPDNASFWSPLLIFLHKQVIEQIHELRQVTSEAGQCRAWVRLSLNEGILSSYLRAMERNVAPLRSYYRSYALVRDRNAIAVASEVLEGLEASGVEFDLPTNSSLLNQWPDYALQLSGLWTPTLKSQPVNSGIDVASAIVTHTAAMPTPQPVRVNEAFSESISNSPFKTSTMLPPNRENVDALLSKVSEMAVIAEDNTVERAVEQLEEVQPTVVQHDSVLDRSLLLDINRQSDRVGGGGGGNSLNSLRQISWSENVSNASTPAVESGSIANEMMRSNSTTDSMYSNYGAILGDYNTMLRNHEHRRELSWMALWEKFNTIMQIPASEENTIDIADDESGERDDGAGSDSVQREWTDSEFVLLLDENVCSQQFNVIERQMMFEHLCNLAHEMGLDAQGFLCRSCQHPLGIGYKKFQVCSFSGYYFCDNCMDVEPSLIPARIIYNWDFGRYAVSKSAASFLAEYGHLPILDLMVLNPDIYYASETMAELQSLRIRLNFVRAYLQTCVTAQNHCCKELKSQFYGREYLYEHIHQYSVADLALIRRGTLQQQLSKAYKHGEEHILKCTLCSMKGFICEICNGPRVLYPFHIDTTYRCEACGAVFHPKCLSGQQPCPKCERIRKRQQQTPNSMENFTAVSGDN